MQSQLIHHSALSFRKLRAMKIKDRSSFHVIILNPELATPDILSSQQYFGQFGVISSIRILKDTSPREAHIRFSTANSAERAIEWCNNHSPIFVNAKYGYQKYCVKFINNQPCDIPGCAMRHSWSDTRDILNFRSLTPAGIDPLCPTVNSDSERVYMEEKAKMMQRIAMLTQKCNEQSKRIQMINQRMVMAQKQNAVLKREAQTKLTMNGMAMNNQMGMNMNMNNMNMNHQMTMNNQMPMNYQMAMNNQMVNNQMVNNQQMKGMNCMNVNNQMNGNGNGMNMNCNNMQSQNWQRQQYSKQMYYPQQQSQQQQYQQLRTSSDVTNTWATNSLCSSESARDSVSPTTSTSTSWEHSVEELVGDAVDEVLGKMGDLSLHSQWRRDATSYLKSLHFIVIGIGDWTRM